jgi:hypothetical protein
MRKFIEDSETTVWPDDMSSAPAPSPSTATPQFWNDLESAAESSSYLIPLKSLESNVSKFLMVACRKFRLEHSPISVVATVASLAIVIPHLLPG